MYSIYLGSRQPPSVRRKEHISRHETRSLVAVNKGMISNDPCCVCRSQIAYAGLAISVELPWTSQRRVEQTGITKPRRIVLSTLTLTTRIVRHAPCWYAAPDSNGEADRFERSRYTSSLQPRSGADPRIRTGTPAGLSRRGMPFPSGPRMTWWPPSESNREAPVSKTGRYANSLQTAVGGVLGRTRTCNPRVRSSALLFRLSYEDVVVVPRARFERAVLAGRRRFERRLAGLESAVLPLDDRPGGWLGAVDSNHDPESQSLVSCQLDEHRSSGTAEVTRTPDLDLRRVALCSSELQP